VSPGLPVAAPAEVQRYAYRLARRHRGRLARMTGLHLLAAAAGLVPPWLVGALVARVEQPAGGAVPVDQIAAGIAGCLLAQAVLARAASLASARLGELVLAEVREEFVDRVLALPLATVERSGTGELLSRSTRDVDALRQAVRHAAPEILVGLLTVLLTAVALVLVSPLLAAVALVGAPVLVGGTRWYLRRAAAGYLRENASYADLTEGLAATVEGAATVAALGLGPRRNARVDADCARSFAAERHTLWLRTVWLPTFEIGFLLPMVATLGLGGWAYLSGWVTLAQVTAAALYVQQLVAPLSRVLQWLDLWQLGTAGLARVLGVASVPPAAPLAGRPPPAGRPPAAPPAARRTDHPAGDAGLVARDLRYAYRGGRDVLHGVSLAVRPGERLAVVGPSGAGKSTLGRLLAGVEPPRTGEVSLAGVPLRELPPDRLRRQVGLLTQEHHVFAGSVRENVALAAPGAGDGAVRAALAAVGAAGWVAALPDGLATAVGAGGMALSPGQAQQLALARLVLTDPHVLVLDEATSLLDPRVARQLERSLAAVLPGRTVVSIAHRLHTAHDADRVAVLVAGRIVELGGHRELVATGGAYAALWDAWQGGGQPEADRATTLKPG
jgi:ABC-type multidrug transport system fused ATPase/permease subunit